MCKHCALTCAFDHLQVTMLLYKTASLQCALARRFVRGFVSLNDLFSLRYVSASTKIFCSRVAACVLLELKDLMQDVAWHIQKPNVFGSVGDDKALMM